MISLKLDRRVIKKKSQKILNSYRFLMRLANDSVLPILSSEYTFVSKDSCHHNGKNIPITDVEKELKKIEMAVNKLSLIERQIIYDKYMGKEKKSNITLYLNYSMSESTFYRVLNKSLIHFAEAYDHGKNLLTK
jgi:ArpU family phage transcriptional regulator